MIKKYKTVLLFTTLLGQNLVAAGYKIPEQSTDSMALAGSNIAKSFGADASYYNPANMAFLPNTHILEGNLMFIHLGHTGFDNNSKVLGTTSTKSDDFSILVPTLYYVSPEIYPNLRAGVSANAPAGLSIEWKGKYPASTAKKFSLEIFELATSMSYQFNDKFAIGLGARGTYVTGEVKSEVGLPGYNMIKDLEGDSIDLGYNLAATYKPTSNLSFSATYRSKIDLTVTGNADLLINKQSIISDAKITIPLPATLNLGVAYEYENFTFLFDYERSYWSSLKSLDFEYSKRSDPLTTAIIDHPKEKNWKDSNTYRFGLAWQQSDSLRLMAGFAIDGNIADSDKVGFELPDSKAYIYSLGANYKVNKNLDLGFGYLYQDRKNRDIKKDSPLYIGVVDGKFINADAQLASISFSYKF